MTSPTSSHGLMIVWHHLRQRLAMVKIKKARMSERSQVDGCDVGFAADPPMQYEMVMAWRVVASFDELEV